MATAFKPSEVSEFRRLFNAVDTDGSGKLDPSEVMKVMTDIGEKVTEAEVRKIIADVDSNSDNEIDFQVRPFERKPLWMRAMLPRSLLGGGDVTPTRATDAILPSTLLPRAKPTALAAATANTGSTEDSGRCRRTHGAKRPRRIFL